LILRDLLQQLSVFFLDLLELGEFFPLQLQLSVLVLEKSVEISAHLLQFMVEVRPCNL